MRNLWTETAKLERWLQVELAAADTWPDMPEGDRLQINERAFVDQERMQELEARTHHDLNSFVFMLQETIGEPASAWIHRGLTSSDIVDTALFATVRDSLRKLQELPALHRHEIWEDWIEGSIHEVSVGKLSGPVGTNATFPIDQEEKALAALGLRRIQASQVVSRDILALVLTRVVVIASAIDPAASGLLRSYPSTLLENVALWHERDISNSAPERLVIPAALIAAYEILQTAE